MEHSGVARFGLYPLGTGLRSLLSPTAGSGTCDFNRRLERTQYDCTAGNTLEDIGGQEVLPVMFLST